MKAISIGEAQGQLGQLIAAACRGELIVITDGDKKVTLEPNVPLNLEEDSPELEAELLKAADGPFTAYSSEEMRTACERIIFDEAVKGVRRIEDIATGRVKGLTEEEYRAVL